MKKIILLLLTIVIQNICVNAEQIPVKLVPNQLISTAHDETATGDKIRFKTCDDVYVNDKIYIKKDTTVIGIVDFIADNSWAYDNAQIDFKTFKTRNTDGDLVIIESPVFINGFEILKQKRNKFKQFFNYCGIVFRGKEVELIPLKDKATFNIWLRI